MATIKRRANKRFTAEIRLNGQYKSKTFDTKVQAMTWSAEMEQGLSSDTLVQGKTFTDLLIEY